MFSNFRKGQQAIMVLVFSLLLLAALAVPMVMAEGDPPAGTVQGITTFTYYPETALTGSGTVTTSAPYLLRGLDRSHVKNWNAVDVFAAVDISGTGTITITPQFSADQSNWANADYTYVADTLSDVTVVTISASDIITASGVLTSSGVITSSSVTTSTTTSSSSSSISTQTYQMVLSADGADYLRMPIIGEYMRFVIAYSGTVTPSVKGTLRNN